MNGPDDVRAARYLVFYGSFDWHSSVHGYWMLRRCCAWRRSFRADRIRALFHDQLRPRRRGRGRCLDQPNRAGFRRPYGWAWLLILAAELKRHGSDGARGLAALDPLTRAFADRLRSYLGKLTYPIRVGTHFNSAFALALAIEYAGAIDDTATAAAVRSRARDWFLLDRGCQAWEPGGDDFLSSALIEAECMRRVLPRTEWLAWFNAFLPDLARREPGTLFEPAFVSDRTDGKIAHLDGLNLTRSWCWRAIASSLPAEDPRRAVPLHAADQHLAVSLPHLAGDYAGARGLAT